MGIPELTGCFLSLLITGHCHPTLDLQVHPELPLRWQCEHDSGSLNQSLPSPYLLQHADNPVGWWEWEPEAFAEARDWNVLILFRIGYAACHWCHDSEPFLAVDRF